MNRSMDGLDWGSVHVMSVTFAVHTDGAILHNANSVSQIIGVLTCTYDGADI